ncbi:MAG: GLPGLI family protein [Flavobacteriia bacterium]|nr:GLPGLI family protein [Flavobacteriia bacterium]
MKYYILLYLTIFCTINTFSQNNNFIATYKIDYKTLNNDSILKTVTKKSKEFTQMAKKYILEEEMAIKELEKIIFILKFNKNASIFFQEKTIFINERAMQKLFTFLDTKDDRQIYTQKEKTIINLSAFGQDFNVEVGKVEWKITKETKKIGKFTCYKAIGLFDKSSYINHETMKIIAWFTPEIPFNYGPKFYSGLPGLIVKLEERKNISYTLKELKKIEKENIFFVPKGKVISAEDLRSLGAQMLKNRYN